MNEAYDIYITGQVDALKRDYQELWDRYAAAVHENALLEAELDRLRAARRSEEDMSWMSD